MDTCPGQAPRPGHGKGVGAAPAPRLAPIADLASEGDFQAPLEQLLDAVMTISGATRAFLRSIHPRSGRTSLLIGMEHGAQGNTVLPSSRFPVCSEPCGKNGHEACQCKCLLDCDSASGQWQLLATPLMHRQEQCGTLMLCLPASHHAVAGLDRLLPALGQLVGLALENTRRAEGNNDRIQRHLCAILMEERQLLANEVHDSLAQNLTCMRMRATLLRDALQRDDQSRAAQCLAEVEDSLTVAHGRVRELITQFRTAMDPRGLLYALQAEIAAMDGLGGVALSFENHVPDLSLPMEQEMQVLHIVREALANIVRHAHARHGQVMLALQDGHYRMTVTDDGVGLGGSGEGGDSDHGHYGLNIMRERARHLGGIVSFESNRETGTRVLLQFPAIPRRKRLGHE